MRLCAIDYQGNNLVPVVFEVVGGNIKVLQATPTKVSLNDVYDARDVRLFGKEIRAFLDEHQIDEIVVKRRATGGRFAGGGASFRMGGVLIMATELPISFLSSQAVAREMKEHLEKPPKHLHKYQHGAFQVGLVHLRKF